MVFVVLNTFILTAALRSASCLPLSESFTLILYPLYQKMHSIVMQLLNLMFYAILYAICSSCNKLV